MNTGCIRNTLVVVFGGLCLYLSTSQQFQSSINVLVSSKKNDFATLSAQQIRRTTRVLRQIEINDLSDSNGPISKKDILSSIGLRRQLKPSTSTTSYYSSGGSTGGGSDSDSDSNTGSGSGSDSTSSSSDGGGANPSNDSVGGNGRPTIFQKGERIAGRIFSSLVVQVFTVIVAGLLTGFGLYKLTLLSKEKNSSEINSRRQALLERKLQAQANRKSTKKITVHQDWKVVDES